MKRSDIGPNQIPAHSHADIFSYELSYKGKRFIVDSGNYSYENNEMRKCCRSTTAHNTVTIDGKDQADMWGTFRVARRYGARNVSFDEDEGGFSFSGIFDGYSELIGDNLVHRRTIEVRNDHSQITFKDEISGVQDHYVESSIHLHPSVKVNEIKDYLMLSVNDVKIKLYILNSEFVINDGWYCPEFYKKFSNKVIKIFSNKLPATLSYSIYPD
jgi:uncharacterized heparinase superfamily protein